MKKCIFSLLIGLGLTNAIPAMIPEDVGIDLKADFQYQNLSVEEYLDKLTFAANALLIQHNYMQVFKNYVDEKSRISDLEGEGVELFKNATHGNYLSAFHVQSEEFFSLTLLYPDIFGVITAKKSVYPSLTDNEKKKIAERQVNGFKTLSHYPQIDEMCEQWMQHEDKEIKFFAALLRNKIRFSRNSKNLERAGAIKINFIKDLHEGKYDFVFEVINDIPSIYQFHYKYINLNEIYLEERFENKTPESVRNYLTTSDRILQEYKSQESSINNFYIQLINEIKLVIKEQLKTKQSILNIRNNRIFYSLKTVAKDDERVMKGIAAQKEILPPHLTPIDWSNAEEKKETSQQEIEASYIQDLVKKPVKKHPAKGQPKKQGQKSQKKQLVQKKPSRPQQAQPSLPIQQPPKVQAPKQKPTAKITKAVDGSNIKEETEIACLFEDPQNEAVIKIFKSSKDNAVSWGEKEIASIKPTDWVNAWYKNPKQALVDQKYTVQGPKFTHSDDYWKTIAFHRLPLALMGSIKRFAKQTEIESRKSAHKKDIAFCMPGIFSFQNHKFEDGNNWQAGIFAWMVDSATKELYHTEFRPMAISKMAHMYIALKSFEVNPLTFPSLAEVQEYEKLAKK